LAADDLKVDNFVFDQAAERYALDDLVEQMGVPFSRL